MPAGDDFTPDPLAYRYFTAVSELLDDGAAVNYSAIARKLGYSRRYVWLLRRARPGLDAWVNGKLETAATHLIGLVLLRMGQTAARGSVAHAEVFLKAVGRIGVGAIDGALPAGGPSMTLNGPTIVNLAVPRPGDPPAHASAQLAPKGAP